MAKIELELTMQEARKLRDVLRTSDNASMEKLHQRLDEWIKDYDAIPVAPWRKVVGHHSTGIYRYEDLECGHSRMLRNSKNWVEDHAKRRRCEKCMES